MFDILDATSDQVKLCIGRTEDEMKGRSIWELPSKLSRL